MVLISELLEEIHRNPPAVAACKLLVEHYTAVGWLEAALEKVVELKKIAPNDPEIARLASTLERRPQPPVAPQRTPIAPAKPLPKPTGRHVPQAPISSDADLHAARKDLKDGYTALLSKATNHLVNIKRLGNLMKKNGMPETKKSERMEALLEGRRVETIQKNAPSSLKSVARAILSDPDKAIDLVIADLEDTMHWVHKPNGVSSGTNDDQIRDILVKRVQTLKTSLPEKLEMHCEIGLMHVVRENLSKTYANEETMYGDDVKDIPRKDFYVTEDNYAWDVTELAQAIRSNNGVMRNPLTKDMFTQKDIRGILMHPQGKTLAALQVQQHEMAKGVRLATIDEMEKLAGVLLGDDSQDQLPSRLAVDQFLAYTATCEFKVSFNILFNHTDLYKCRIRNKKLSTAYDVLLEIPIQVSLMIPR